MRAEVPRRILVCGSREWARAFPCLFCGAKTGADCRGGSGLPFHQARLALAVVPIRERLAAFAAGTEIVVGGARGADELASEVASALGFAVEVYHADWRRFGRRAGPIRNARMLIEGKPDLVLAFNLGTPGTEDMMRQARQAGLEVIEVRP